MTTALRSWFFSHRVEPDTVVVIDCSRAPECGAMSVTNDIENVVAFMTEWGHLRDGDLLVYQDTDGRWDGVWHRGGKFLRFELLDGLDSHRAIFAMRKLKVLDDHPDCVL